MTPLPSDILKIDLARDAATGEFVGYRLRFPAATVLVSTADSVPRLGATFTPEIGQTVEYRACAIDEGERITETEVG